MSVHPLHGRVCVRELLPKKLGYIHLPDDYHDNNVRNTSSHKGLVLAMGPPACTKTGVPIPADFKVGDTVLFVFGMDGAEKSRVGIFPDDGLPCVWITQEEVIGIYETEYPYGMDTPEDPRCEPEEPLCP